LCADNKECKYVHFRLSSWIVSIFGVDLLKDIFIYGASIMGAKQKMLELKNMCNILNVDRIFTYIGDGCPTEECFRNALLADLD